MFFVQCRFFGARNSKTSTNTLFEHYIKATPENGCEQGANSIWLDNRNAFTGSPSISIGGVLKACKGAEIYVCADFDEALTLFCC